MKNYLSGSLALLTITSCFASCAGDKTQKQPNILFIMSDDHTQQAIFAYNKGLLDTVLFPNIDRLAREGALFKNSFVTNSICAPSRAVMLTGKYSHLNGKIDNFSDFDWDQPNVAKILKESGYETALIGKIHIDGAPQGFNYYKVLPGQGSYYNPVFIDNGTRVQMEGHCSPLITEISLNWLENIRDKNKPFALLYHHKAPHRNWQAETKYLDFLEDKEFPFPENFFDDYEGRGSAAREQEMEIVGHMRWGRDMKFEYYPYTNEPTPFIDQINRMTDEQRDAWRAVYNPLNEAFIREMPEGEELAKFMYHRYLRDYLKTIKSVDDGIGELLKYLESNGILENTLVIYTSDQGFYLGEHGWFDKRFMYEESFSTPLIMRYPAEIKPGTIVDEMVVNIDLAPTFLDFAGIEKPSDMQGESLRQVAAGRKVRGWRDAVYYHYYEYPSAHMVKRHYGVRTDRYKLMHFYYDVDEWEMYDLLEDPREMRSVYNDPAYASVQSKMHDRLKAIRLKYGDSDELTMRFLNEFLEKID